jgi:hypothetical protein
MICIGTAIKVQSTCRKPFKECNQNDFITFPVME